MKPLNLPERRKAFWNFLLFFVLTIGVVITAIFLSFDVPLKDNQKLRSEADMSKAEMEVLQRFEARMYQTMNLIDTFNVSEKAFFLENRIDRQLKEMDAMVSDSSSFKNLYLKILENLKSLKEAKVQLRGNSNVSADLAKKDAEIEKLRAQYNECVTRYNNQQ